MSHGGGPLRALTETERQLLTWAAEEPLPHDEDYDAIDALVAAGLLAPKDDTLSDDIKLFAITDEGWAALEAGCRS